MAERVGFEPTLPFRVNTLSKRAPSATRPSLRLSTTYTIPSLNEAHASTGGINARPTSRVDQIQHLPSECITRNAEMVHTRIQLASRRVADAGRVEQCRRPYARGRTECDRNQRRHQGTELLPALEQRIDSEVRRGLHTSTHSTAQGTTIRPCRLWRCHRRANQRQRPRDCEKSRRR